jgi:exopolysaccharide biosynthesis polyprenyl glycosylphosphotransferase
MSLADMITMQDSDAAGASLLPAASALHDRRSHLRLLLVCVDVAALAAAWAIALSGWAHMYRSLLQSVGVTAAATLTGILVMRAHGLYLARISNIRLVEMSRVFRSSMIIGVAALAGTRVAKVWVAQSEFVVGTVLTLVFLLVGRGAYRAWLTSARRHGRFTRDLVLVGTNREAADLLGLLRDHPEVGLRIIGVVGDRTAALRNGLGALWCGGTEHTLGVLNAQQTNGVIIATGALAADDLNGLVRTLHASQVHVHLSSGMRGIDYRRMRALPLAHEPLFYLENSDLSQTQYAIKRALDVAVSVVGIIVTGPIMLAAAAIVKVQDGGPILFRQVRVGKDGTLFRVFKFRSMVIDAEARLKALEEANERSGPLFKMDRDPRVTRFGRILRSSSIDELPQLFNVLRGEMSLVGPRPALPAEVARFDDQLAARSKVRPGITGLWQVEARDNPAFSAYRRLDLFYVENWSATLDLVIMLATVEQVIARLVGIVGRGRKPEQTAKTAVVVRAA